MVSTISGFFIIFSIIFLIYRKENVLKTLRPKRDDIIEERVFYQDVLENLFLIKVFNRNLTNQVRTLNTIKIKILYL